MSVSNYSNYDLLAATTVPPSNERNATSASEVSTQSISENCNNDIETSAIPTYEKSNVSREYELVELKEKPFYLLFKKAVEDGIQSSWSSR